MKEVHNNLPMVPNAPPVRRELSKDDWALVKAVFANGPDALRDAGMTNDEIRDFISRPEIVAQVGALEREFKDYGAIDRRRKFIGYQALGNLLPKALGVLERSLEGPKYLHLPNGAVMQDAYGNDVVRDPEPTSGQSRAAMDILDRLGINKTEPGKIVLAGLKVNLAYESVDNLVPIEYDADLQRPVEQAQSRDRRRKTAEALAEYIPELAQLVDKKAKAVTSKIVSKSYNTRKAHKPKS